MNGDSHFSEVFLDDVVIDDSHRVGEMGNGWTVAQTVLANERSSIGAMGQGSARSGSRGIPGWLHELSISGCLDNPVTRGRAVAVYIHEEVSRLNGRRAAASMKAGRPPGPEGSGQKLRNAAVFKERAYLLLEAQGAARHAYRPPVPIATQ